MSLSAVNAILAMAVGCAGAQTELSQRELVVWHHLQSSVVTLMSGGAPQGTAALIDPSGLFLAHRSVVQGPVIEGILANGVTIRLDYTAQDPVTRLVLLQAEDWRTPYGTPVRVPPNDEVGHGVVFAVLPSGPIRAAYTGLHWAGLVPSERRIIPMNEVRFEQPANECTGALMIDEDGELLGVLGATLSRDDETAYALNGTVQNLAGADVRTPRGGLGSPLRPLGGGGRGGAAPLQNLFGRQSPMGPSDLTVAYTAGVSMVRRVVDGFRRPDHQVQYPSLGLLCKDTPGGGALVQVVQPNSGAEHAGMQAGDILVSINGQPIRNQVDFALVMLAQNIGDKILIHLHRHNHIVVQEAIVGRS